MDLKKILTVPGKPGLYRLVSQGKSNIIVESLLDKSRMPIFASMQASSLSDICIFTMDEDMPLEKVFQRINEVTNGNSATEVSSLDNNGLKKYMGEILPEYDKDRVHVSDMKKLFSWYNILHENEMFSIENEDANQEDAQSLT